VSVLIQGVTFGKECITDCPYGQTTNTCDPRNGKLLSSPIRKVASVACDGCKYSMSRKQKLVRCNYEEKEG